jgi:antitoxin CcdA
LIDARLSCAYYLRMTNTAKNPPQGHQPYLDAQVIADAKELGINISAACEKGLVVAISKARGEKWLRENRAAIASSNAWVEKHGLPLAKYRMF